MVTLTQPFALTTTTAASNFAISSGNVVAPSGARYIARGINVADNDLTTVSTGANGTPVRTLFPGLNFVRVACYSYAAPSSFQTFVNQMTGNGIVVKFENHRASDGSSAGGGQGVVYTGSLLTAESNWYASMAAFYINNPYVWFGTNNEPSYVPSIDALSTWHQATYNAIRNTGSNAMILICLPGGGNPGTYGTGNGMRSSVYNAMRGVIWDFHQYAWSYGGQTGTVSQASMQATMLNYIGICQTIHSLDGVMPVISAEYGISTDGVGLDVSGTPMVRAVIANCGVAGGFSGCAAWHWGLQDAYNNLNTNTTTLTPYGQIVAAYIAS